MDEFLTLIIFFIVIGVVERVLKAAQKAKGEQPTQRQEQVQDEGAIERLPAGLQELIAEELGINLERKPRIAGPGEPAPPSSARAAPVEHPGRRPPSTEHPSRRPPPAPHPAESAPVGRERVVYPSARREVPETGRERAGDRGAAITRARREVAAQRRRGPALVRRPLREVEQPPSLEERALLERGEAVSLEQPRRPEDHKRFHDLYMVEEAGPGVRRRRGPLPDRWDWSAAQKAIIWAEILGPPKGLED
ncbi:MAG: hypothetical protein JSW46_18255 [Gemmatimonadota bacterium]|nr:MAG: hypothetical protein JSW46_18255 [Gemmatimonadota bacterium]